jgi:multidrug resistance efflux pump
MPQNNQDIEIRSEEVQEILSFVPNWMIRWGNSLFLLLIIMLLFISWFIKYPDIINADVIITTEIPPQKEYARVTGKIDTLFVKDTQHVIENETLAVIENTANYSDVFFLKSIVDTIKVQKKSFIFPIDKLPILFLIKN